MATLPDDVKAIVEDGKVVLRFGKPNGPPIPAYKKNPLKLRKLLKPGDTISVKKRVMKSTRDGYDLVTIEGTVINFVNNTLYIIGYSRGIPLFSIHDYGIADA